MPATAWYKLPAYAVMMTFDGGTLPYVTEIAAGPYDGAEAYHLEWEKDRARRLVRWIAQRARRDPEDREAYIHRWSFQVIRRPEDLDRVRAFAMEEGVVGFRTDSGLDADGELAGRVVLWEDLRGPVPVEP